MHPPRICYKQRTALLISRKCPLLEGSCLPRLRCSLRRGGSRPKLKGGQLGEGAPKTQGKISAPKARENFWGFIRENSLVFLLNNALVYMFRRIQNESLKKDRIWVRIRGAFLAKKGAPKLNFHREGGAVAPICPPPKSATVPTSLQYGL